MRDYHDIGVRAGGILLPRPDIDLMRWAVIACDQFTSTPGYWEEVSRIAGDAPSTLNLTLPEIFLNEPDLQARIDHIHAAMARYIEEQLFSSVDSMVLVERECLGRKRHGLMLSLDLEQYDFSPASQSLIRASEGTILSRIPPRVRIRQHADLEFPHILVLIDDQEKTVIEPLLMQKEAETPLYQTPLMLGSGMVRGWAVSRESESQAINALRELAQPSNFHRKYQTQADKGVLLFAIGDGNHSLAAAKTMWEHNKSRLGMNHPSRFALVEIENVRQEGLVFEPIHRVLFEPGASLLEALDRFGIPCQISSAPPSDVLAEVDQPGKEQKVGVISAEGTAVLTFTRPTSHLALGTLQRFLDDWLKQDPSLRIDYIHGTQTVMELGAQPGNIGFYVSTMPKDELFPTVIHDGVLPRKAFSMGEAVEKRFYLEGRRIR